MDSLENATVQDEEKVLEEYEKAKEQYEKQRKSGFRMGIFFLISSTIFICVGIITKNNNVFFGVPLQLLAGLRLIIDNQLPHTHDFSRELGSLQLMNTADVIILITSKNIISLYGKPEEYFIQF